MIPAKAIKPIISKSGRDNTELAVGTLLAYNVVPNTPDGVNEARRIIASRDTYLVPSYMDEYYDGIEGELFNYQKLGYVDESYLLVHKVSIDPRIKTIINAMREFYGISSIKAPQKIVEKVQVAKPAPVKQPEPEKKPVEPEKPKQVTTPVFTPPPQPPSFSKKKNTLRPTPRAKTNKDRWGYLTGYELDYLEYYTRDQLRAIALNYGIRNASRMSGPQLISLIKSDEDYQKAKPGKVDTPDTPTKAKKPLQRSGKKIYVEGGKGILYVVSRKQSRRNRLAKLAEDIFAELADEKSFELEEDEAIEEALEESKEVELVTTVKLPKNLNFINAKYMAGQHGLHDLEFESDIDRAIYFAGKQSKDFKESPTKDRVREWLADVTHLDYNTSFGREIIFEYRKKIVEKIRELIKQVSNYLILVPEIYDGEIYSSEEDVDVDEIDPDIANKLDELRKPSEEELKEEDKSIADNITDTINDVVGEDDEDEEDPMAHLSDEEHARLMGSDSEEDLGDVKDKLVGVLNKTKKQSSYTSNKKIFDSITANFGRLQATLDMVNSNLEKQNSLIKTSINSQLAIGELVSNQTNMLGEKFDLLLQHFERQNRLREDEIEDQKNKDAENKLEGRRDSAGVSDFEDLTKGPTQKKRTNKIEQYLKSKLTRKLYRRLPKSLRNARQRVRKLQRIPAKLRGKVANKIISSVPKGTQGIKYLNRLKGVGAAGRMAGPARYAFAGLEYSERKAEGQSELQALSGVGAGLAGASLGGGLVAAGVALLPTAPTGFGAVAAGGLILLGSILGGTIGGNVADTITKADKVTGKYETGTDITRKVENPDENTDVSPMSTIAGVMIASTQTLMNATGSSGAQIASVIDPISAQLANDYDVPITLARTNVGGSLPPVEKELKKIREKRKQTPEEELSGMEKDLLETQDPESFADKLLKMLDPEGKFQELLKKINHRNPVGETGEGMATFGESGIDKGTGYNSAGWVHGHFQNSNKQSLVSDTLEVVKKLINSGVSTVITATNKDLTKDMSEDELRKHIEAGVDGHKKYGSGVYAIDVSVPAGTKVPYELENVFDSKGPGGIVGTMKGRTTQIMHLAPGSKAGAAPGTTQVSPGAAPTGDFDVIIPLDHVKPGNENKIPDKKGGNTFENARATGAAGRERQHQDSAAAKIKAKLEAKGLRVKVITPEDFGNYEDYDKYITAQASKNVRIVPLHFDAAVGQGGTGFLTRTRAGDSGDSALARPIQQALSTFQRSNPSLGNLGPSDTVSNATINRASASPAALVEMGSMVAWEKQHGSNFTQSSTFDKLATGIAEGIYQGGGFNNNIRPPAEKPRFQSLQGKDGDEDTKYLIVNQQAKPRITGQGSQNASSFVSMGDGRWRSENEMSTTIRNLYMQRLGQ